MMLFLAGCAGTSSQQYGGQTVGEYSGADGTTIRIISAREADNVEFDIDLSKGKASYKASGVKAFEGQAIRADVEKVLTEEYGEALPSVVDGILKAAGFVQ